MGSDNVENIHERTLKKEYPRYEWITTESITTDTKLSTLIEVNMLFVYFNVSYLV